MTDYEVLELESKSFTAVPAWKDGLVDISCGSIAGAAGKLIEYPFDTIKVRLQSQSLGTGSGSVGHMGPWDCLKISLAKQNVLQDLYRGISSPIIGAAAENASLFFTYNLFQSMFKKMALAQEDGGSSHLVSLTCGGLSGAVTSFILTPFELVKCQMQVYDTMYSSSTGPRPAPTISQLIRSIWHTSGVAGFWRGQTGTLVRETGGSAAYFGAYECVTGYFKARNDRKTNTNSEYMMAGACAGVSYNFSLFPADTIKSRMQTQHASSTSTLGFFATGKEIWRLGGIRAFYRGCGITCCRSAPGSAVIFLTYEKLKSLFI